MEPYPQAQGTQYYYSPARADFEQMIARLCDPEMLTCTSEALEVYVTTTGRELLRKLIQSNLDARQAAEQRVEQVVGSDLVARRRAERGRGRLLATTVGRVEVGRIAYRSPRAGVADLHPADARLALPERVHSHCLQYLVAQRVAAGSLRQARQGVSTVTGQDLGIRQMMEVAAEVARDVEGFYQHQRSDPRPGAVWGDLLVLSVDATGVNMIPRDLRGRVDPRPEGPQPPSGKLSRRERSGRSRMAVVTAVYDVTPTPRAPAQILPRTADERAAGTPTPRARCRQVNASVEHSTAPMVSVLYDQGEHRDPEHKRRWVFLVDGARHQLDRILYEADTRNIKVDIIIDFVHVLQYLWDAASDLHPTHHGRAGFVQHYARLLLEGHAPRVICDLTALLDSHRATGGKAPNLERTIGYLDAKRSYLNYHVALALGWPIATGVIEGACRYVVKDRLAVTGARWSLGGAEAILLLRTLITNGDFDQYWRYHLEQEYQRVHASKYQNQFALAA